MEHKHTNHSTTRETMKAAEMKKQEISTYNIKHVIAEVADWSIFKLASNYQRSNRSFPSPWISLPIKLSGCAQMARGVSQAAPLPC